MPTVDEIKDIVDLLDHPKTLAHLATLSTNDLDNYLNSFRY